MLRPFTLDRAVWRLVPLLAAGFLLFDLGCALEHPDVVPPQTTCWASILNRTTGLEFEARSDMAPFLRGITSCSLETSRELWEREVARQLNALCAPGAPTSSSNRMRFCTPNDWCLRRESTGCSGELAPAPLCSPIPPVAALPLCPEILGDAPRLVVDRASLNFGSVPVGELRTATVRVTNGSDGQLTVFPPQLEQLPGDASSFASFPDVMPMSDCAANPANPAEVRAGGALLGVGGRASCSITARFQPNFGGTKRMRLLIPNNGMTPSFRMDVVGLGQAGTVQVGGLDPRAPRPALCFNVAPEATPDGLCRTRSFTLSATGAAVRLREILVPAGYRLLAPATVPVIVPRDGSITFTLRTCEPSPPAATLRLNTNADPGMFSLELEPPSSGCLP